MKLFLLAASGVALSAASAIEAARKLQDVLGPETGVGVLWIFQAGVLMAAGFILIRLGMLAARYQHALDKIQPLVEQVDRLERRQTKAESLVHEWDVARQQSEKVIQDYAVKLVIQRIAEPGNHVDIRRPDAPPDRRES